MSKSLDTKIREAKDLGAWRVGVCQPSRPRPWSRKWGAVDKVGCHNGLVEIPEAALGWWLQSHHSQRTRKDGPPRL